MDIQNLLNGSIPTELIQTLSKKTGEDTGKIQKVISMALPSMLTQLKNNATSEDGAKNLDNALAKHDGSALDNITSMISGGNLSEGLGILGHVFGDKKENVASNISKVSGVSTNSVTEILASIAPIVMGFLGKQKQTNNLDASGISSLLGNILGSTTGNGDQSNMNMIEKLLDRDGDGSIADDAMDIGSKILGNLFGK